VHGVAAAVRRQGLAAQLIAAARNRALAQGAQRVEGDPVQARIRWHGASRGLASLLRKAISTQH